MGQCGKGNAPDAAASTTGPRVDDATALENANLKEENKLIKAQLVVLQRYAVVDQECVEYLLEYVRTYVQTTRMEPQLDFEASDARLQAIREFLQDSLVAAYKISAENEDIMTWVQGLMRGKVSAPYSSEFKQALCNLLFQTRLSLALRNTPPRDIRGMDLNEQRAICEVLLLSLVTVNEASPKARSKHPDEPSDPSAYGGLYGASQEDSKLPAKSPDQPAYGGFELFQAAKDKKKNPALAVSVSEMLHSQQQQHQAPAIAPAVRPAPAIAPASPPVEPATDE